MAQFVEPQTCEICSETPSSDFCQECKQHFCKQCKEIHPKYRLFQDHTFGDEKAHCQEGKSDQQTKCAEHNEDFIYCCEYCQILICKACFKTSHKGHRIADIDDVLERMVKYILDKKNEYVNKISLVDVEIGRTREKIGRFQEKSKKIECHVQTRLETAITHLKEITSDMLHVIRLVKVETLQNMKRSLDQLEKYKRKSLVVLSEIKLIESENQNIESFKCLQETRREMMFCIPPEVIVPDIVHEDIHWNRTLQDLTGNIRIADSGKKRDETTQTDLRKQNLFKVECRCGSSPGIYHTINTYIFDWMCSKCKDNLSVNSYPRREVQVLGDRLNVIPTVL